MAVLSIILCDMAYIIVVLFYIRQNVFQLAESMMTCL